LLAERSESEIICPVFYRVADSGYNKAAQENPVLVIDGCSTRCASRLAAEKNLKIAHKINVTEQAKGREIKISNSLRMGKEELKLAQAIAEELLNESDQIVENKNIIQFPDHFDYEIYRKEKYIYRIPKEGFYFNENDCWVFVTGNVARVGVTDFVQQSMSDILFFTPPVNGSVVEQFGELGTLESSKATFEVISPVSGKIIAVNEALSSTPELVNSNPYEKGWIADVEIADFESDKEMLIEFDKYFEILKKKVDEYRA
jgi:glycine cleavage system H protein